MTNKDQEDHYKSTLNLVNIFVKSNQRKRINLLSDIESDVENIFSIGKKIFDDFDQKGDDWAAGWLLQVLKKHKPIFFNDKKYNWFFTSSDENINYEELQLSLLEQNFEDADRLTSSYLRKLAGKLAENRLEELIKTYSIFEEKDLIEAVLRIKKRLGPQRTTIAIESIKNKDWKSVCKSVLEYYDNCYDYEKTGSNNIKTLDMTDIFDDQTTLRLIKEYIKS
ncbi:hypothetical protein OA667_03215 [Prochlorococcus sp. AH-716-G10]|nr:hypothetical protein [Prochlorococcus sp. AH-716-G10]